VTVYLPPDCVSFRYDFWWRGDRYTGCTDVTSHAEAAQFEAELRRKLRRRRAGLEPAGPEDTPTFTEWAPLALAYAKKRKHLKRPEQLQTNLRMILGFWGAKPTKHPPIDGTAPYHNLRLGDPIENPALLEAFEQWMDARGISGARKNHYRSACSSLYKLALLPAYRKRSQISSNPFEHIPRDKVRKRITTFDSPVALRLVIAGAPWHTRIALAIGGLAPKLRLKNVLALRWDTHVARDRSTLTDPDHKTDQETGLPLVTHVSAELRRVLEQAWKGRKGAFVVHYHGRRVRDIKTGLKRAVQNAGLTWGRASGVTYHTLRHTMATELVRLHVAPQTRDRVMGWLDPQTSQTYTHLVPDDEIAPLEQLGVRFPVADLVEAPTVGRSVEGRDHASQKRAVNRVRSGFRSAPRSAARKRQRSQQLTRRKRTRS
jgi:site-specific recombinase XerC